MLVRASISPEQIRWYAEGALGCWDTLNPETAAHECQRTLRALLDYLSSVDGAQDVVVTIDERTEIPVRLKNVVCHDR